MASRIGPGGPFLQRDQVAAGGEFAGVPREPIFSQQQSPWYPPAQTIVRNVALFVLLAPALPPGEQIYDSRPVQPIYSYAGWVQQTSPLLSALPPGKAVYAQQVSQPSQLAQQVQRNSALLDIPNVAILPPGESSTDPNRFVAPQLQLDEPRRNAALLDLAPLVAAVTREPIFTRPPPLWQPPVWQPPNLTLTTLSLPAPSPPFVQAIFQQPFRPLWQPPAWQAPNLALTTLSLPMLYPAGMGDSTVDPLPQRPRPGWITNLLQSTLSVAAQPLPPGESALDPNRRDIVYPKLEEVRRNSVLLDIGPAAPLPFQGLYGLAARTTITAPPGWTTNLLQSTLAPALEALPPGQSALAPNWRGVEYPRLDDPRRNSALLDGALPPEPPAPDVGVPAPIGHPVYGYYNWKRKKGSNEELRELLDQAFSDLSQAPEKVRRKAARIIKPGAEKLPENRDAAIGKLLADRPRAEKLLDVWDQDRTDQDDEEVLQLSIQYDLELLKKFLGRG